MNVTNLTFIAAGIFCDEKLAQFTSLLAELADNVYALETDSVYDNLDTDQAKKEILKAIEFNMVG